MAMENIATSSLEEEVELLSSQSSSNPLPKTLTVLPNPIQPTFSLTFGLGLGLLFVVRAPVLKPLSTAIKLADGAIKGSRAFHLHSSPNHQILLLASKALIKGYNISKPLNPTASSQKSPFFASKRLKACVGAFNLVRCTQSPVLGDGLWAFGFLRSGYIVSKNFLKVLEGLAGFQLDSAIRNGVDAVGLVVKATAVAKELAWWVASRRLKSNRLWYPLPRSVEWRFHLAIVDPPSFQYNC